ncbi:MAG TPA: type II toxin-antitoxin system RelE/ParE family toxin [Longimicrobiaceae bacterium]|nr:type II toxin-antitoxin system RelE/ParE family toxin [Longimicrobiaceae bacterium]
MESYELRIKPSAAKELEGIDNKKDRQKVVDLITTLAKDPRPPGSLKLTGREGHRVRQGSYRVLYEIDDEKRILTIFKIAHRRDVYR